MADVGVVCRANLFNNLASAIGYNRSVRRLLAISLLLLFGVPLVSPLFALSANPDANLPACCRRNGAHHCHLKMEQMSSFGNQAPSFTAPSQCPFYPRMVTAVQHTDAKLQASAILHAAFVSFTAIKPVSRVFVHITLDTAWQKRGPPALSA